MGAHALALTASVIDFEAHSLLIALVIAMGTGAPALIYTVYRGKKTGPAEAEELVARASREAVEAMRSMLIAASEERKGLVARASDCEAECRDLRARISVLESQLGMTTDA